MTGVSMRNRFGVKLAELAAADHCVVALDGDLANSTKLDAVATSKPDAFYQMGIAEQNMVGVAVGMSQLGLKPWVSSFASFLTKRAYEQIVVSVAQTNSNVKLIGSYSGLLTSNTGKSHHSLDDLAILSTIPNMQIIAPADAGELEQAMQALYETTQPSYLRVSRDETIPLFIKEEPFVIGKGKVLNEGHDILIVSTGSLTYQVKQAIENCSELSITHLHMPSIKPFDAEILVQYAKRAKFVITVEEHYIRGGLGSIVTEILSETHPTFVHRIGVKDEYSGCGTDMELLDAHGLSAEKLTQTIKQLSEKRNSL